MRRAKKVFLAFFFSALMIWQGFFFAKAEGESPFVLPEMQEFTESVQAEGEIGPRTEVESKYIVEAEKRENTGNTENTENTGKTENTGNIEITENTGITAETEESENAGMEPVITDMEKDSKSYYTKAVGFSKEAVDDNIYELWDSDGNPHFVVEYRIAFDAKSFKGTKNKDGYRHLVIKDSLASGELDYFDPLNKYPGFSFDYEMDRFQPSFRRGVWRSGELRLGEDRVKYFEAAADDEENHGSIFALRTDESGKHAAEEAEAYLDYGNSDGRSGTFQYDLGELGANEGFELRYFVEINEIPVNGAKYKNKVELEGVDVDSIEHIYTVKNVEESYQDEAYSIKIKKMDKDSGEALEGAVYCLSRINSNFKKIIESNKKGIAVAKNLCRGDYELQEIVAPDGYKVDKSTLHLRHDSFGENKILEFEFENEKEDLNFRNVIVEKKWPVLVNSGSASDASLSPNGMQSEEGFDFLKKAALDVIGDAGLPKQPDKIMVYLLKNGNRDEDLKAELSKDNGWVYVFENLPRMDENGNLIQYTVEEKEVAGFTSVVSGTMSTKFTITNYYTDGDRISIPVTKVWEGGGRHPYEVKVQLLAKREVLDTVVLDERNDWQHTFDELKNDLEGKEIQYELREIPVDGYSARMEKVPGSAFGAVIINTKIGKPEEENSKSNPPGGKDIPPVSPNKGGDTPGSDGIRPAPPSAVNPPKAVETPPLGATTPTPAISNNPGEVLGTDRSTPDSKEETKQILGADREPEVLGTGRGWTKTFDSGMIQLYFALCLVSTAGFALSLLYKKKRMIRRK